MHLKLSEHVYPSAQISLALAVGIINAEIPTPAANAKVRRKARRSSILRKIVSDKRAFFASGSIIIA